MCSNKFVFIYILCLFLQGTIHDILMQGLMQYARRSNTNDRSDIQKETFYMKITMKSWVICRMDDYFRILNKIVKNKSTVNRSKLDQCRL